MQRLQPLTATARRPSTSRDACRLADGIASSLRQFSASIISREDSPPSKTPPTRRATSQQVANDLLKTFKHARQPSASPSSQSSSSTQKKPSPLRRAEHGGSPSAQRGAPQNSAPRGLLLQRSSNPQRGGAQRGGPQRGGAPRGGARGGGLQQARGGRGGRGGRGSRGGRTSSQPRFLEEDESTEATEEETSNLMQSYYANQAVAEQVLDEQKDHFRTDQEIVDYERLMEAVEQVAHAKAIAEQMEHEATVQNDPERKREAQRGFEYIDEKLKETIADLVAVKEEVYPIHEPQELDVTLFSTNRIGRVPVGAQAMGSIVEDVVRYVANRQEMDYEDPKKLARKLINGDIVKFQNVFEKMVVTRIANSLEGNEGKKKSEQTEFAPLAPAARGDLVKSIVSGRYEDPKDAALEGPTMMNIARILSNNATYGVAQKGTVLAQLQSLLPANRPQAPDARAKAGN